MRANAARSVGLVAALALGSLGCGRLSGKPGFRPETLRPAQTLGFAILYKSNCSGCHGDNGLNGAAPPLNNPVYLAWAGRNRMLSIVAKGVSHASMPAFGQSGGGLLTSEQVAHIVDGMISQWGKPGIPDGAKPPGYTPASTGDAAAGKAAFQIDCARCHGTTGGGALSHGSGASPGSIVDPTYLSLVSDQGLRDIVVAGLPGEGMPDWRGDAPGNPLTDKNVTDIVAWMAAQRVQFPGQPFPTSTQ